MDFFDPGLPPPRSDFPHVFDDAFFRFSLFPRAPIAAFRFFHPLLRFACFFHCLTQTAACLCVALAFLQPDLFFVRSPLTLVVLLFLHPPRPTPSAFLPVGVSAPLASAWQLLSRTFFANPFPPHHQLLCLPPLRSFWLALFRVYRPLRIRTCILLVSLSFSFFHCCISSMT